MSKKVARRARPRKFPTAVVRTGSAARRRDRVDQARRAGRGRDLAARRPGDGVRLARVLHVHRLARLASGRPCRRAEHWTESKPRFDGLLPAALGRAEAPHPARRSRCPSTTALPSLAELWPGVQLAGARDVRHVRRPLRRPPGSAPHLSCTRSSSAIRCARTTRRRSASRSCAATTCRVDPLSATKARSPLMADDAVAQAARARPQGRAGPLGQTRAELPPEPMTVNMGPSHPAMHGTVRIVLDLDGETIVKSDVQPGYLHRCFEKEVASTRRTRRCSRTRIGSTTSRR